MSDDQAQLNIVVSKDLKRQIKHAIVDKKIDSFQDGYLCMMELGLKEFKKLKREDIKIGGQ